MRIEDLVKRFNGTTVEDIYGAMNDRRYKSSIRTRY